VENAGEGTTSRTSRPQCQVSPAITVTETHVAMYLGLTRELPVGPVAVPDVLPVSVDRLGWRIQDPPMAVLAFVGLDWQIVRPLRVGDTMHARSRISPNGRA